MSSNDAQNNEEKLEKVINENSDDKNISNEEKIEGTVSVDNDNKKELSIEEKLRETEEKLLRSLAELENQRRRFEKEIKDAFDYGGFNFAKETLAILDNLERAKISLENDVSLKNSDNFKVFIKNIDIIEKDLVSIFEKNRIKRINSIKEKFDPNLHQAMLEIEDEKNEPGIIVQEIQPGYKFGERLLRPSFVGVSKKKTTKKE